MGHLCKDAWTNIYDADNTKKQNPTEVVQHLLVQIDDTGQVRLDAVLVVVSGNINLELNMKGSHLVNCCRKFVDGVIHRRVLVRLDQAHPAEWSLHELGRVHENVGIVRFQCTQVRKTRNLKRNCSYLCNIIIIFNTFVGRFIFFMKTSL